MNQMVDFFRELLTLVITNLPIHMKIIFFSKYISIQKSEYSPLDQFYCHKVQNNLPSKQICEYLWLSDEPEMGNCFSLSGKASRESNIIPRERLM